MLNQADNELMCRVGPGTPMGAVMRQYWLPLLYSWELTPDGAPLNVRLLGEDLVAFRDTNGTVGLVAKACPHRKASMYFGRNEECGLRCVYHGWKFDATGACVDMPSEPAESTFKDKIRITAYQTGEAGGIIWAYMGAGAAPGLPQFEWCTLPAEQVHHAYRGVYRCNYVQAMEGDIDSSHLFLLHGRLNPTDSPTYGVYHHDTSPRLEVVETDYGLYYGASRHQDDDTTYWRTTQWAFPVFNMFPATEDGVVPMHMYTPIDDHLSMHWGIRWHPTRVMPGDRTLNQRISKIPDEAGMGPMRPPQLDKPFPQWWPVAGPDNDYLIDREVQRTKNFSGIPTIRLQDAAMIESMGSLVDRSQEHLGTSDGMIIAVRRKLIRAATRLRDQSLPPPAAGQPELYRLRSCSTILPRDTDWQTALSDWHNCRTTTPPAEALHQPRVMR